MLNTDAKPLIRLTNGVVYSIIKTALYNAKRNVSYPGVAQLVARLLWEQDAAGSNPVTRTTFLGKTAFLGGFSALKVRFSECA